MGEGRGGWGGGGWGGGVCVCVLYCYIVICHMPVLIPVDMISDHGYVTNVISLNQKHFYRHLD